MINRIPQFFSGSRICIICEGDEEYEYLDKLISLQVWSKRYEIVLENAEGNGNIPARYQDNYQEMRNRIKNFQQMIQSRVAVILEISWNIRFKEKERKYAADYGGINKKYLQEH